MQKLNERALKRARESKVAFILWFLIILGLCVMYKSAFAGTVASVSGVTLCWEKDVAVALAQGNVNQEFLQRETEGRCAIVDAKVRFVAEVYSGDIRVFRVTVYGRTMYLVSSTILFPFGKLI